MHLKKEITKCLEFKSKDEEIELVPETEFFRDAPKEISKPVSNFDNACVETNCNGMLRVNFSFRITAIADNTILRNIFAGGH